MNGPMGAPARARQPHQADARAALAGPLEDSASGKYVAHHLDDFETTFPFDF